MNDDRYGVIITNQDDEVTHVHSDVTAWDVKGPFLALTKADGKTVLINVPAGHEVEIEKG